MANTTIADALQILLQVTATAATALANAQQISALIQKATTEGRNMFTADEWTQIQGIDTAARQQLVQQIAAALQK